MRDSNGFFLHMFQKNSTVTTVLILKKSFNHDQNSVLLSNGNFEREVRSLVLITGRLATQAQASMNIVESTTQVYCINMSIQEAYALKRTAVAA